MPSIKQYAFRITLYVLCFCASLSWAANPFDKTRPIAAMKFLKQEFDSLETQIDEQALPEIEAGDFNNAQKTLDDVETKLKSYAVENPKAKQRRRGVELKLAKARETLTATIKQKELEEIFDSKAELDWKTHASNFESLFKENENFVQFLSEKWEDNPYKLHWLALISGNLEDISRLSSEEMVESVDDADKDRAQYLAGVAMLEQGKVETEALREAEGFLAYSFQAEEVQPLAEDARAEASARILLPLLHDEIFADNKWQDTWGRIWEIPEIDAELENLPPIPAGLIPDTAGVSKLEELLKAEEDYKVSPHLKLAWLYSGLGWDEAAQPHIKKELQSAKSGTEAFIAWSYFYGRSLEETYVQNGFLTKLTEKSTIKESGHIIGVEATYIAALASVRGSMKNPKVDYMRRWIEAYKVYQTAADRNRTGNRADAYEILEAYKTALEICPESFFFRERCFNLFTLSWAGYYSNGSVSFPFHGHDGFYQLTFSGNDLSSYAPLVQTISLIQFFDKVTYARSLTIRSINDVTPDKIRDEFLAGNYGSIPPTASDFRQTMQAVYQIVNRNGRIDTAATDDIFTTRKQPWRAVGAMVNSGNDYKAKHLPLAATRAYLKSIALIPTSAAYTGLQAVFTQAAEGRLAPPHLETVRTNIQFCRQQQGRLQ